MASTEQIKELRKQTGLSIIQCQKALEEVGGDKDKAIELLKKRGAEIASKKSERTLGAGTVSAYIHAGETVGAIVELLCETDFVSKNPEFKEVAKGIAMHITAMNPGDKEELLEQPLIKDPSLKIRDLITNTTQKFGERTELGEFTRLSIK